VDAAGGCSRNSEHELKPGYSLIEWGPFHPLLSEPVLFKIHSKDEVIDSISINTGYNYRGIEELCEGKKPADVLELLERSSSVSGIAAGIAFAFAVEKINNIEIPDKAKWLRLILNEMSCFKANLYSLNQTAQSLGLLSDCSEVFRLIDLFNESAEQISAFGHHENRRYKQRLIKRKHICRKRGFAGHEKGFDEFKSKMDKYSVNI